MSQVCNTSRKNFTFRLLAYEYELLNTTVSTAVTYTTCCQSEFTDIPFVTAAATAVYTCCAYTSDDGVYAVEDLHTRSVTHRITASMHDFSDEIVSLLIE
jgi:hypothetical protein